MAAVTSAASIASLLRNRVHVVAIGLRPGAHAVGNDETVAEIVEHSGDQPVEYARPLPEKLTHDLLEITLFRLCQHHRPFNSQHSTPDAVRCVIDQRLPVSGKMRLTHGLKLKKPLEQGPHRNGLAAGQLLHDIDG